MHPDLKTRRRVLVLASQSYARADAAWMAGLNEAAKLIPGVMGHGYWAIGNPGSRIRRLYEQREHALERLAVTRLKLQIAKDRIRMRQRLVD